MDTSQLDKTVFRPRVYSRPIRKAWGGSQPPQATP